MNSLLCKEYGKSSAPGSSVKRSPYSVKRMQKFALYMCFLYNVINKCIFSFCFQFPFIGLVPHTI